MPVATADAFRRITVQPDDVTIVAEQVGDTLTLVAGTGISLVANPTSDQITIVNTTIAPASTANWDTAYSWGNHATAGYLKTAPEYKFNVAADDSTQRIINSGETIKFIGASNIATSTDSEGNVTITGPNLSGYITSESDPIFTASPANGITNTNITNWNTAYSWGNHATAGYLTSIGSIGNDVTIGSIRINTNVIQTVDSNADLELRASGTGDVLISSPVQFTSTVSGVTATHVGLGNVTNESKATMFTSPTFTGTVSGVTATHVGLGNVLNVAQEPAITLGTTAQYFRGDKTFQTLNSTAVGLGNVTNESKATMFSSPTFTGTVSGVTATHVGLGNVTNESKATMFTSPTFTGLTTLQQTTEVLNTKTSATGTVAHDFSTGAIWHHSAPSSNFTVNLTNVPTTENRTTVATLIIQQGLTPYIPNAFQVNGSSVSINWLGGSAPSGNSLKFDVVSFTLILRSGALPALLGSLSTYG